MVRKIRSEDDFRRMVADKVDATFTYPVVSAYCTDNVDNWLESKLPELQGIIRTEINEGVKNAIDPTEIKRHIAKVAHPFMMDLYNINEIVEEYLNGNRNFRTPGGTITSAKSVVDAIHRITRKHFR